MKNKKQKTEKQILIKFILLILLGAVIGFFIGIGLVVVDDYAADFLVVIQKVFKSSIPYIFLGVNVSIYTLGFWKFRCAKKIESNWDGEDEEVWDEIENNLGFAMVPLPFAMVLNFFLYAVMLQLTVFTEDGRFANGKMLFIASVIFMGGLILGTVLQKKVVDFEKKLNPEKRGNTLDSNFTKEWVESCDEAEKQMIYKASYKSYQATTLVCLVMCLVSIISLIGFGTGIFPVFCVCTIWIVLQGSYSVACIKFDKKK